jgi:hypothetical protein
LTAIKDAKSCSIQVSTLRATPFSLLWGSSVYSTIVASNSFGDSATSTPGNGAIIITYADAPTVLEEIVESRTSTSISFSWVDGPTDGGSAITDYRVSYDNALGAWEVLATGISLTQYAATGLTFGLNYAFKVEAQNRYGYSEFSTSVSILCATVPVAPSTPATVLVGSNVIFNWDAPVANGKPITGYNVYIRKSDLSYVIDTTVCNGLDATVTANS